MRFETDVSGGQDGCCWLRFVLCGQRLAIAV